MNPAVSATTPAHTSAAAPIVEMRGVRKTFGSTVALDTLDLALQRGCVTAILGPNGAGKSTTINLMLGLLRPDTGTVRVLHGDPTLPATRRAFGAMQQTVGAPDTLRVSELIRLWSSYYDAPLPYEQVVRMAGLHGIEKQRFSALSGGQRQRAAFAFAMCGDPPILFFDEPTAGLDVEARRDFWKQVRQLADGGHTIVLSTHYLEEADALADRIVVLAKGRIIADGTAGAIKARIGARIIRCATRLREDEIAAIDGVLNVIRQGRLTTITAARTESVVYALLSRDGALSDLSVSDGALEDAFLSLVNQEG